MRDAVPSIAVDYNVFVHSGAKVTYFNFHLAREMGLIPEDHKDKLNKKLEKAILDTFAIQIINEWDIKNKTKIPKKKIKPHKYMATRYLQLQHPKKDGSTSGDGRSIWNGEISHKGKTWDISSCGTGATKLSPGTANEGIFYRTGDPEAAYGNGCAIIEDGMGQAIMSEMFHQNHVATERTLAIIKINSQRAIAVRASECLIRPAHMFGQLRQEKYDDLKTLVDYYYDRQVQNQKWPAYRQSHQRYRVFGEYVAETFAKIAAQFESDYIFCWLAWDGDNILMDGSIIDYGSIRQFGLFHYKYKYDDGDRFSTSIVQQWHQARHTVQTFAQMIDYLQTGERKNFTEFSDSKLVKLFDENYKKYGMDFILEKVGYKASHRDYLINNHPQLVEKFKDLTSHFERILSLRKEHAIADGITQDVIFSVRSILRNLPKAVINNEGAISSEDFLKMGRSTFCSRRDFAIQKEKQARKAQEFQKIYLELADLVAGHFRDGRQRQVLLELTMRSSIINRFDRITGDSAIDLTAMLCKYLPRISADDLYRLVVTLAEDQTLTIGSKKIATKGKPIKVSDKKLGRLLKKCLAIIAGGAESI